MPATPREWVDKISESLAGESADDQLVVMDGYDDCILGVCQRFNDTFVVYDLQKVLAKLQADGLSEEEAREFFEFNQLGAWVGDRTPGFIELPSRD